MVALTLCSAASWYESKKHALLDKEMSLTTAQPCPVEVWLSSQKCLERSAVELCAQFASDPSTVARRAVTCPLFLTCQACMLYLKCRDHVGFVHLPLQATEVKSLRQKLCFTFHSH